MADHVIYEPRGAAREYAALACNIYRGCSHGCTYCYAPATIHMSRDAFKETGERQDFLRRLELDAINLSIAGKSGRVLLCFTTDPYQAIEAKLELTHWTIMILHQHGFDVEILTKGGVLAVRDLDLFTPRDSFGVTMVFDNPKDTFQVEPGNTNTPYERIYALRRFHEAGIPTFVSLEPVVFPAQTLNIIQSVHQHVDGFKVGKLNHDKVQEALVNWKSFGFSAQELLESLGYRRVVDPDDMSMVGPKNRLYYIKQALLKEMQK